MFLPIKLFSILVSLSAAHIALIDTDARPPSSIIFAATAVITNTTTITSSLACYVKPQVEFDMRNAAEKFPFRTQTPLSEEGLVQRTFRNSSVDMTLYRDLAWKVTRCSRSEVHMSVFGGSFTLGNGCGGKRTECPWHQRLVKWMRAAFPHVDLHHRDLAVGSTTSAHAFEVASRPPQSPTPPLDLILFDYSCNDLTWFHEDEKVGTRLLIELTRKVIAELRARHPTAALVWLSVFLGEESAVVQQAYEVACRENGIALLSYPDAVLSLAKNASLDATWRCNNSGYSIFWPAPLHYTHPPWIAHQLVADMVAYFIAQVVEATPVEVLLAHAPPRDGSNSGNSSSSNDTSLLAAHTACSPAFMSYSTLSDPSDGFDTFASSFNFTPYFEVPWHQEEYGTYFEGWELRSDKAGKPPGWVAERVKNDSRDSHIAFMVSFLRGALSLTYLETYRNAGVVEFWLSQAKAAGYAGQFHKDHPAQNVSGPPWLGCCDPDKSKLRSPLYSSIHPMTFSLRIDTFNNHSSRSALRTQSFRVNANGKFVLHLRHARLSGEEWSRRGGDKVKILGVSSC